MLSNGSYFADYRIERQLGRGGMGAVYLARNPDLPRSEALKILSVELSQDAEFRARFIQEADVAAGLDHPNIVSVHRRGQFDGQLWIAMQYVDGPNADEARRAGAMPPARAVYVIGEVSKALDYAHRRGVVHRDVKPANFLLSNSPDGDERVMLGDFGIARALGQTGLTTAGSVMATVSYAAPEVLAGHSFDGRADIYSLGCSLFRLLTNHAPFGRDGGLAAIIAAHLHQPPPTVSDRVPGISSAMDAVIATAMAKDPDRRFTSARELAHAAAAALRGSNEPGWTPGATPAAGPGGSPRWYQPPPQTTTLAAPPAPPPRRHRTVIIVATAITAAAAITAGVALSARAHSPAAPNTSQASTTAASTTTPAPAAIVPSALAGLLVPLAQFADIMGAPDLRITSTLGTFENDDSIVGEPDQICVGPFDPAQQSVYGHTGALGVVSQLLQGDRNLAFAGQVVVALPNDVVAQRILTDQVARWSACAGRTITKNGPGQPPSQNKWTFGPVRYDNEILAISYRSVDVPDSLCQRAMTTRKNVAIDTLTCRYASGDPAIDVLNAIAAKIAR